MKWLEKIKSADYNNFYPFFFTIVFILILIQYTFNSLDAIFYDLWVRGDVFLDTPEEVVLITLDDESDQFLGEVYPYTYATHSRFIKKLLKDQPAIVNYIVPLIEPENDVDKNYQYEFKKQILNYKSGGGTFRFGTLLDRWGEQVPPKDLQDLGYSLSVVNIDNYTFAKDDVSRRAIINVSGEDSLHLWIAHKYLERDEGADTNFDHQGVYYNREADALFAMFRYSANPSETSEGIRSIPYHRVLVGNFPNGFFTNKIVLIGSKYPSNPSDYVNTPFNKKLSKAPKINIHGLIVDALIKRNTVYRVPDWLSDVIAILLSIILSFIISRVQPTKGLIITISIMIGVFLFSYFIFTGLGVWIKLSHIILSIFVVYYIWVPFRAIGEYQTRYAIQEEAKLLKKVDNLKQNFISLMSHDLKTPVAKIAGIADILQTQYDNKPEVKTHLTNIVNSTKDLNNFITSILDLTKIESRNLDLKKTSRDVNKIIEGLVVKLRYEAEVNKVTLKKELEPLYPITVDVVLINRVISNLVENAIKYSGEDTSVVIKTWDDEEWVYIEISDTGVGIKPDDLDSIFDKFYRVKNDSTHAIKGSGLGLYLVKYFIELHQGEISAESTVGEGTTFLVKLINA